MSITAHQSRYTPERIAAECGASLAHVQAAIDALEMAHVEVLTTNLYTREQADAVNAELRRVASLPLIPDYPADTQDAPATCPANAR